MLNTVQKYGTTRQVTDYYIILPMCFACWITKVTDIHSENVKLITFPQQQWFREPGSVLCYRKISSLVMTHAAVGEI